MAWWFKAQLCLLICELGKPLHHFLPQVSPSIKWEIIKSINQQLFDPLGTEQLTIYFPVGQIDKYSVHYERY
jgi:hypothetical protein